MGDVGPYANAAAWGSAPPGRGVRCPLVWLSLPVSSLPLDPLSHLPTRTFPTVPAFPLPSRAELPPLNTPLLPQEPLPHVSRHPFPKFLLPWGCFTPRKLPWLQLCRAPGLGSGAEAMARRCDLALRPPASVPGCPPALSPGCVVPSWSLLPASAPVSLLPVTPPLQTALSVRQQLAGRDVMCIAQEMLGPHPQFGGRNWRGLKLASSGV